MKKKILLIIAILFILQCFTGCSSTTSSTLPESFDEETVTSKAEEAISLFNERDYQSIIDMGDETLKNAITAEEFASQCDPYLDKDGTFQEFTKTVFYGQEKTNTTSAYGGIVLIGQYENGKIQFTIAFNEEMELSQFVIK